MYIGITAKYLKIKTCNLEIQIIGNMYFTGNNDKMKSSVSDMKYSWHQM